MNKCTSRIISDEMGKHRPEKRNDLPGVMQQGNGRTRVSCGRLHGERRA